MMVGFEEFQAVNNLNAHTSMSSHFEKIRAKTDKDDNTKNKSLALCLIFMICCSVPYDEGYEIFTCEEYNGVELLKYSDQLKPIAYGFAEDLTNLHPLRKLDGINANK